MKRALAAAASVRLCLQAVHQHECEAARDTMFDYADLGLAEHILEAKNSHRADEYVV
jgi:hypothetical protein